jgi:hypothetical protein
MTWWGTLRVHGRPDFAASDRLVVEGVEGRESEDAFLWRAEQYIHPSGEPRGTVFVSKQTGTALAATDGSSRCRLVQLYEVDGWCTWTFGGYQYPQDAYYAIRAWNNAGYNLSTDSPVRVIHWDDGLVTRDWGTTPAGKRSQEWKFSRALHTRDELGAYGLLYEVDPAFQWRLEQFFTLPGGAPAGICVISKLTEMALGATPNNAGCRLVPLDAVDGFSTWTFGGPSFLHRPKFYGPLRTFQNDDMNLNVSGGHNAPGDVVITYPWGHGRNNEIWRFDSSLA